MLTYTITQVDDGVEGYYEATLRGTTITEENLEDLYCQILRAQFGVEFKFEFREEE